MCGIIGFFNFEDARQKAIIALQAISHRGLDSYGYANQEQIWINKKPDTDSKNIVGHVLHSINNFVSMPIKKQGLILTANCEIYNYKELNQKHGLKRGLKRGLKQEIHCNDSTTLLNFLSLKGLNAESLDKLDGVYAFALWDVENNEVTITRDLLGEKPLWYYYDKKRFAFASEKKALLNTSLEPLCVKELNPRMILTFNLKTLSLKEQYKGFLEIKETKNNFKHNSENEKDVEHHSFLEKETLNLLERAVKKRIPPSNKVALLFSGGLDSCFLALMLKKLGVNFKCYTASLKHESFNTSHDEQWSLEAAKALGLDLEIINVSLQQTQDLLKTIVPLIEDNNVTKVNVALPFFVCCEKAKKDGFKVIFSGLGSEELFAGYNRHLHSYELNEECLSGFRKLWERDLYRDDVVTMYHNLELRTPFLDIALVNFSLQLPSTLKINGEHNKFLLRKISLELGLPSKFAFRKKMAAQYGSNFDKAITKFSRTKKLSKSRFLKEFYDQGNVRLGSLWSTGKDSCLATQVMLEQNYDLRCLITLKSKNPDSYMYHGPNTNLAEKHSQATNVPLLIHETEGEKEKELLDLTKALSLAKEKYFVEGIITGALFSNYQRKRIEQVCDELGLKVFSPLWHMDQEKELEILLAKKIDFCLVKVAAEGLDQTWLGRTLTEKDFEKLSLLKNKLGLNPAGEGGEYESLVLDAPFFNQKLVLKKTKIERDGSAYTLIVEESTLELKNKQKTL